MSCATPNLPIEWTSCGASRAMEVRLATGIHIN